MLRKVEFDCVHCNGKGRIFVVSPDSLRETRVKAGHSLRTVAKTIGVSAPYLSDVERGRRNCTKRIEKAYAKL